MFFDSLLLDLVFGFLVISRSSAIIGLFGSRLYVSYTGASIRMTSISAV